MPKVPHKALDGKRQRREMTDFLQTRTPKQLRDWAKDNRKVAADLIGPGRMYRALQEEWQRLTGYANTLSAMAARKENGDA